MSVRVRKKVLALSLSAVIASATILASGVASAQEFTVASVQSVTATPTASNVLVNGEKTDFQAYTINGNNYFKLRDVAHVLNGTEKSFSVGWDGQRNAISLETGKAYQSDGSEMKVSPNPSVEQGVLSTSTIYLDGKEVDLTAYTINGNNYFKLRDLADALDFGVTWDGSLNTIRIDSNQGYVAEGQAETPPVKEEIKEEQKQVVRGVEVEYGRHAYGIRSQEEYDEVMSILKEKLKGLDAVEFEGGRYERYYYEFLDGARKEDYVSEIVDYRGYHKAEKLLQPLLDLGLSKEEVITVYKAGRLSMEILREAKVDHDTNSLADLILRGNFDCVPEAYLYSAIFDMLGYRTATVGKDNHAFALVEINGEWRSVSGGILNPTSFGTTNPISSFRILEQPTYGDTFK